MLRTVSGAPRRSTAFGPRKTRRWVLGAGIAAATSPAFARFPHSVPDGLIFFVGNSFTRQHAIPALVCRIAAASGTSARCHPHTANGAWLSGSLDFARSISRDRGGPVPGVVVLQDHSIAPLTADGRRHSAAAMAAYRAQFDGAVLFETWPRAAGHHLYKQPGMPTGPEEMVAIVHDHYRQQADRLILTCIDQNSWAHLRLPIDEMRQGCSMSLFQLSQQCATMSS